MHQHFLFLLILTFPAFTVFSLFILCSYISDGTQLGFDVPFFESISPASFIVQMILGLLS